MKVLIVNPDFNDFGGVSNYYLSLKNRFKIQTHHFIIGKRVKERGHFAMVFRLFKDYFRFIKELKHRDYEIVHINPCLNFKSVVRDGVLILIAKYFKRKIIVFFRGWQKTFEQKLRHNAIRLFRAVYRNADVFIVTAVEYKNKLRDWGFRQTIYLETAAADDNMLDHFDIHEIIKKRINDDRCQILFLARIIKDKGIYETIDAVRSLHGKYSNIELVIAGDGEELQMAKNYVRRNNISNVIFTGYVRGEMKKRLFETSHIYCLPTTHGEGMPNSIAEAMAFGLPVVTRPVGGIVDFFENSKNGFMSESKNPTVFANYIERLFLDKELYEKIAFYNYKYAQDNFLASKVVKRIEGIYQKVLEN